MTYPTAARPAALLLAFLAACGGGKGDTAAPAGDGGAAGDGGGDGGGETPITYPDGRRILLYNGHGGYPGDAYDKGVFEQVDARWKERFGWNTDVRDYFADDMSDYRMVGLVAPGATAPHTWSDEDVAVLQGVLDQGARLVVFGDYAMCADENLPGLLAALGVDIRFTGESADQYMVITSASVNSQAQPTAGVSDLRFKEPCWVDPTGGDMLVRDDDGNVIAAMQRPGNAGDVLLIGDFQFMDDGGYLDYGDDARFADNLVIVDPDYEAPGDTGS